jgi:hypothetical protein
MITITLVPGILIEILLIIYSFKLSIATKPQAGECRPGVLSSFVVKTTAW